MKDLMSFLRNNVLIVSISLLLSVLANIILGGLISMNNNPDQKDATYPEIYNYLNSISIGNLNEFIEKSKESELLIYYGRPSCIDCNIFEPKLIEMVEKYELSEKLIYVNTHEVRKNEEDWKIFTNNFGIQYTPTIALYTNGEVKEKVEWTPEKGTDMEEFELFLKSCE